MNNQSVSIDNIKRFTDHLVIRLNGCSLLSLQKISLRICPNSFLKFSEEAATQGDSALRYFLAEKFTGSK